MVIMDAQASPLVLTKLRVPAARPRTIPRARLIDRLDSEQGAAVILVCAPAGYGKTTLLAAWAQSLLKTGTAAAWYALDPSDDDPIPFGAYLIASFIQALGPLPELVQIAARLRFSPELELRTILPELINTLAARPADCVLILDDYHLIRSPAVHSAVAYLVEHAPENLRLVLGSRSDPPLPLARLRARGRLLEIRTDSLRFTLEEAAAFFTDAMRLPLPPEGIAALAERTEGWIAGLQLASLAIQGPPSRASHPADDPVSAFTGSHRYLVEYLMEEVFNRQTEEVQAFLLSTAILERLCAPLADAVLAVERAGGTVQNPASGSDETLRQLERANLFVVALDEQSCWYRYHHLFRDFLRSRLNKRPPERIAALHRAASAWLAEHGHLREAAAHAFQTQDWEYAAGFVEQHSFTLILHSEIATIYAWCSLFPEPVMQAHPMLCLMQGLSLAYNFRLSNRARVTARLRQADRLVPQIQDRDAAQALVEIAAVVRTFLAMAPDPAADPAGLLAVAKDMLGHYPQDDPGRFSGQLLTGYAHMALHDVQAASEALETARAFALRGQLYFGLVETTFHLARIAHSQGQLRRAVDLCQQGQAEIARMLPNAEQALPALGCLDVALGAVLLELDQLEDAERHLLRGLNQMGAGMNPHYLMTALLALFRLYEIQRRPAEALKTLDRLDAVWPDITFCTQGLRVRFALRSAPEDPDALASAAAWCRDFSPADETPPPGMGPFGAADAYYTAGLAWIRAMAALGNTAAAAACLDRQLKLAAEHGLQARVIALSLLEAEIAAQPQANRERAWTALDRALAAAEPEGFIRSFDQGETIRQLLVEAAGRDTSSPYLRQLLAAIGSPAQVQVDHPQQTLQTRPAPGQAFLETLTERELDVLRLMAQGATNQAIADQLVITVGTVKSHINHILGKLGAQNRTEAVARAREAGLLKI